MKLNLTLIFVLSLVFQAGCSSITSRQHTAAPEHDEVLPYSAIADDLAEPVPERSSPHPSEFSKETLLQLLTAEVAGQRGNLDQLVASYRAVAIDTKDKAVIKRAVNAAQYAKKEDETTELAALWSKVEPENIDAHQLAAFQFIKAGNYSAALFHMEKVLELEGPTTFDRLAVHARNLGDKEKQDLLKLYQKLLQRHPDNSELLYGLAVLQELNGLNEEALQSIDQLLADSSSDAMVIALKARLINKTAGLDASLKFLEMQTQQFPQELQLATLYGRTLVEAKRYSEAQAVYQQLIEAFPDTPHLKLSLSLIAMENNNIELARQQLSELLDEGQHLNEAHFYLGRIADQAEQTREAIYHYQQVTTGERYFDALARSGFLLIKQGRAEEAALNFSNARQSLPDIADQLWELEINLFTELGHYQQANLLATRAMADNPSNLNLRYARAIIRDKQGDLDAMEQDLRKIIQMDPEHSAALNALGYTLADKTDRYDEAYELIAKAISIDPENPAILDSMGWVLYKLGRLDEALSYLQKAYDKLPDPEIAAHLGEVLWMLGRNQDALKVWRSAHDKEPDHQILSKTLERLSIDI